MRRVWGAACRERKREEFAIIPTKTLDMHGHPGPDSLQAAYQLIVDTVHEWA